jgi:F0F1-type ATP synthase membrane subunit c/vacuolar-type H+-ATPase subunit K
MIPGIIGAAIGLGIAFWNYQRLNAEIDRTGRTDTKMALLVASYAAFPIFGVLGFMLLKLFTGSY